MISSCARWDENPVLLGQAHQRTQALHLRGESSAPRGGKPIIDASFVRLVARRSGLGDETTVLEPTYVAVKVSGLDVHVLLCVVENVLADAIAVPVARGEDGEDQQLGWLEHGLMGWLLPQASRVGREHLYLAQVE